MFRMEVILLEYKKRKATGFFRDSLSFETHALSARVLRLAVRSNLLC